ncbi:MAG: hypothetical protein HFJ09_01320 [Lachnospiraceae bacterium]|nr:hypothetical protein [Lachnospiraceae bacterium]
MGMLLAAKGMKSHQFTYIQNSMFLVKLAETFDKRYGEIVKWWIYSNEPMTEKFANEVLEIAKGREKQEEGLSILIKHSDVKGYLEPEECEKVYASIKNMHIPKENDTENRGFDYMLDCWRYMTKYCSENKQRLEYK